MSEASKFIGTVLIVVLIMVGGFFIWQAYDDSKLDPIRKAWCVRYGYEPRKGRIIYCIDASRHMILPEDNK